MKITQWKRIKIVNKDNDLSLKDGECFLFGDHIILQMDTKKKGDQITYYRVIKKEGKLLSYVPVYDILYE